MNAVPYLGILLALKFQEDYSTEQHHCSENITEIISALLWNS